MQDNLCETTHSPSLMIQIFLIAVRALWLIENEKSLFISYSFTYFIHVSLLLVNIFMFQNREYRKKLLQEEIVINFDSVLRCNR